MRDFLPSVSQWLWKMVARVQPMLAGPPQVRLTAIQVRQDGMADLLQPSAGPVHIRRTPSGATIPHGATPVALASRADMDTVLGLVQGASHGDGHTVVLLDITLPTDGGGHRVTMATACVAEEGGDVDHVLGVVAAAEAQRVGIAHRLDGAPSPPYRNCALTHLLQDVLVPTAHVTLVTVQDAVQPDVQHLAAVQAARQAADAAQAEAVATAALS